MVSVGPRTLTSLQLGFFEILDLFCKHLFLKFTFDAIWLLCIAEKRWCRIDKVFQIQEGLTFGPFTLILIDSGLIPKIKHFQRHNWLLFSYLLIFLGHLEAYWTPIICFLLTSLYYELVVSCGRLRDRLPHPHFRLFSFLTLRNLGAGGILNLIISPRFRAVHRDLRPIQAGRL